MAGFHQGVSRGTEMKDEVHRADQSLSPGQWPELLREWAQQRFETGESGILDDALTKFERTLIDVALTETGGQRQEAARRLGWGRNTLTRKIKSLGM